MHVHLSEKLKALRKEKNVSQEKLAQYLNVSFQAVSKWENAQTCPDVFLLPDIARFFGITVDELLQVEQINEEQLYAQYEKKACDLYRNDHMRDIIPIWLEAYQKMPNNVQVKEMLMSAYFDVDKKKYQNEIVELATEIYNSDAGMFYKGQAIKEMACTYASIGNSKKADVWASRACQIYHSQEMIYMQILDDGKEMNEHFRFANYWYFNQLFYMGARLSEHHETVPGGIRFTQAVDRAIAQLYEVIYPNDDMSFESLRSLCAQHRSIAEDEIALDNNEDVVKKHLVRAMECAIKSMSVEEHNLTHPLLYGWHVSAAPSDNKQVVQMLKRELEWDCFDAYRSKDWFMEINRTLHALL